MKAYEDVFRIELLRRVPVIIRVDGKAFHTLCRQYEKPFDDSFMARMDRAAVALCEEIQGAQLAYVQSDEISVLIHGYRTIQTQPWVSNGLQKMCSLSASEATKAFNAGVIHRGELGTFDARVFLMPEDEVCNYFVWRQQDATRNSINAVGQSYFPDRDLHGKNTSEVQEMLHQRCGINWNDFATRYKRGRCAVRETYAAGEVTRHRWVIDAEPPIFTADRTYIERHVRIHEEAA